MRKRKASTYIMVVFMASVIIVTGTAMLSLVVHDIKLRVDESKQIQNLYGSDSNLDLVYSIILKNSDMAVSYANCIAYKDYKDKENIDYNKLNREFKNNFLEFLGKSQGKDDIYNNTLCYGIEHKKYMSYKKNDGDTEEQEMEKRTIKTNYDMADVKFENSDPNKQENIISIKNYNVDEKNLRITIEVESTFVTKTDSIHNLSNKKKITTKYIIKAPDYSDNINRNDKNVNVNLYQVQQGLYVDNNLNISDSNLAVNGTTWVKGKDSALSNDSYFAYDKYNDGIMVNKGKFSTNGNLSTNKTISLINQASLTNSSGDVYAQNIYLGPGRKITEGEEDSYSNNNITVENDIVANNDLTIDAKNSNISVNKDYYGISDKTENSNINKINAANNSSSIIINTNNNSKVNINNNAYISGLAYIDFNADKSYYKTGESVAVIGNYRAYTEKVMSEIGKDDSITFSEHERENGYDPLGLIEFSNADDDTNLKSDHFIEYYKDKNNTIKDGGISIGNKMFSIGASNYKNSDGNYEISKSSLDDKKEMVSKVNSKKYDYGINVFNLGTSCDGNALYNKVVNDTTVKNGVSNSIKTIKSQIDFDSLPKDNGFLNYNSDNTINQKYGYSILDGDDKKKESNVLIIDDGVLKSLDSTGEKQLMNLKSYDPDYAGKVKAVIITKGDLVIRGNTDIYGCVIVGGNLYVDKGANVSVNYDENVIENIMAHNDSIYQGIFKSDAYKTVTEKKIKIGEKDDISYAEDGWYDANKYLKQGLWKLTTPEVDKKRLDPESVKSDNE